MHWDADRYDAAFGFVTEYGAELLDLIEVPAGSRVIDVGCGTGGHAAELAARGYEVVGVDVDPAMLERARAQHSGPVFAAVDARALAGAGLGSFDAAVSNAALHWIPDQDAVLGAIHAVLVAGAPFVAEMGGAGNVAAADAAIMAAAAAVGCRPDEPVKYYPRLPEQAVRLERAGFRVEFMRWFERPTPLADGQTLADWSRLFRAPVWAQVPPRAHAEFAAGIDAAGAGLRRGDRWYVDYCRLRFVAVAGAGESRSWSG